MTDGAHKPASKRPAHSTVQQLPADSFLRILAKDRGAQAIGICLAGTASDGVVGLKASNLEQAQVNSDLSNPPASVHLSIVMSSDDLHSHHFMPQAQQRRNLIASDVGRPITDIRPISIDVTHLKKNLERDTTKP